MRRSWIWTLCSVLLVAGFAALSPSSPAATIGANDDGILTVDQAFRLDAIATAPDRIEVRWIVAPGHYLYRDKMKFTLAAPAGGAAPQAALGKPTLPPGDTKNDEYFGEQVVYHKDVIAQLPVARAAAEAATLPLKVSYQGCSEIAGICYPPETRTLQVSLPAAGAGTLSSLPADGAADGSGGAYQSEQSRYATWLRDGSLAFVLGMFFLGGLGLSLTPCVLPMVPILSGIITSQGPQVTTRRAFLLSVTYVLGMACTYAIAGAAFAAAGSQVQAVFQQTWIIVLFAGLFVALALSMFGFFNLQVPAAVQTWFASASNKQTAGTFGGVAIMGALSALIITTCVAPPLVGALTVIAETGNVARGAFALFAMSIGMGAPLLAVGASGGKLLPRAGVWMDTIKKLFGALMLGVAVWMLSRVLPERVTMLLWAVPLAVTAFLLLTLPTRTPRGRLMARAFGTVAVVYGALVLVGGARGATNPLNPLQVASKGHELPFRTIKSLADLEREVTAAQAANRPLLLDFYADWCVSCKEMERYTFPDAAVRTALANAVLLRADVTANDEQDQQLLKHFGIFGPPTIAFYGADGSERRDFRVVGFMKANEFAALLPRALGAGAVSTATTASLR